MKGYWNNPEATAEVMDAEGWLHTGDKVEIDDEGYITIVDRKKEIMVLSNGENVPPAVIEQHLNQDPCFLQTMVIAHNRPYVSAPIVPDTAALETAWQRDNKQPLPDDWRENSAVSVWVKQRMQHDEHDLSSFMQVKHFAFVDAEWTQADGLLTATLKLKRRNITAAHSALIESMYADFDAGLDADPDTN